MKKVLLINMPYGALERPALGLSILKPVLAQRGIEGDIRYLNFSFADLLGYERYHWISSEVPYTAFAGDWTFAQLLYGKRRGTEQEYFNDILRRSWHLNEADIRRVLEVQMFAGHFLDHTMAAINWRDYFLVGFTSTFEQNLASLALAKRIKQHLPQMVTVFGGANWEGEMGVELHKRFPFVDFVCSGESERSFPDLVEHIAEQEAPIGVAGIVYRENGESVSTGPAEMIREMDQLPIPDYSDFFREFNESPATSGGTIPTLLIETSRGCWWGAKSHCTFCGLNGMSLAFRSKSADRVLKELEYLTSKWSIELVEAVDNILDMKFFTNVLPALAAKQHSSQIFFEVKANLNRKQVELLRDAGVNRIQPGIESMSDHVLKLMRKGTTALRNIQLLKWCKECNVSADWNLLYGFPGETRADYNQILKLLPAIRFLGSPVAWGPIRMDRFSPYFDAPASFGLNRVRALEPYRHLYPFPEESLKRIAYYFDFDYDSKNDPSGSADEVVHYLEEWKRNPEMGVLCSTVSGEGNLELFDSRSNAASERFTLSGLERAAYEYCDEQRPFNAIQQFLRNEFPNHPFEEAALRAFLTSLVENRLMITDGTNYLALAINAGVNPPQVSAFSPEPVAVGA